jgi:hypothetical protein
MSGRFSRRWTQTDADAMPNAPWDGHLVLVKHGLELKSVLSRVMLLAGTLFLPECRCGELARQTCQGPAVVAAVPACDARANTGDLMRRAVAARRAGCCALARDEQTCVDKVQIAAFLSGTPFGFMDQFQ